MKEREGTIGFFGLNWFKMFKPYVWQKQVFCRQKPNIGAKCFINQ